MQNANKWFLAVLGGGAILRLYHLAQNDFWYDEAFTGLLVRKSWSGMFETILRDVHPPMYYVWLKLFSFVAGDDVFGLRLFSAICGILSVVVAYFLMRELTNERSALLAAVFIALSPFLIQYSQETRMYALLAALILSAGYFFVRGIKTGSRRYFVAWGLLSGSAFLTHYVAIFYVPFLTFCLIWAGNKNFKDGFVNLMRDKKIRLGALLATMFLFLWVPAIVNQLARGGGVGWITSVPPWGALTFFQIFLFGLPPGQLSLTIFEPLPWFGLGKTFGFALTCGLLALLIWTAWRRQDRVAGALLIFSTVPLFLVQILSLGGIELMVPRFFIPSAAALMLALGHFAASLRTKYAVPLAYAASLLLVVHPPPSLAYRELAQSKKIEGKNIYALDGFDYALATFYFERNQVKVVDEIGEYSSWPIVEPGKTVRLTEARSDPRGVLIWKDAYLQDQIKKALARGFARNATVAGDLMILDSAGDKT